MICPACRADLEQRHSVGAPFHQCPRCHGVWLDAAGFVALIESPERQQSVMRKLRQYEAEPQPPNHTAPLPCPTCGRGMHRHEYAAASGVHVDTCREHGIWFDHDELRRVVEFVRAGGLKNRRDRHADTSPPKQESEHGDYWYWSMEVLDLLVDFFIWM